jgi:hypothetical protein
MRFRRNADVDMRELERRAAAGDPAAQEQVVHHRIRTGALTAQWLADAGPWAARFLPDELTERLVEALIISRTVALDPTPDGRQGWFPGHRRQDVCPRGHEIGPNNPFVFHRIGGDAEWVYAYEAEPDQLFIHDDWDSEGAFGGVSMTSCYACDAHWPSQKVQG